MKISRLAVPSLLSCALFATGPLLAMPGENPLHTEGGGTGQSMLYEAQGLRAGSGIIILTSTQRALIPLSLVDPKHTGTLRVGLDLPFLNLLGFTDKAGRFSVKLPIPNNPSLKGLGLLSQALTFPGKGTFFDVVSDVAVTVVDTPKVWNARKTFTAKARAFTTTLPLGDGKHLVVGGGSGSLLGQVGHKTTEVFDEAFGTYTPGPSMSIERAVHTQSALKDGRFLLAGGVDVKNDPQKTSEYYDPKKKTFVKGPTMSAARMGHSAITLKDGRVLVTGGLSQIVTSDVLKTVGSTLSSTEIWNPKTGLWTKGPNMTRPRVGHISTLLPDGRVLIAGGLTYTTIIIIKVPAFTNTCEIFDPKTNKISSTGSMKTARSLFSAESLLDGRVLVAGGVGGSITNKGTPLSGVEIYDPKTGKWTQGPALGTARGLMASTRLRDGRIVLLGGAAGTLDVPVPVAACEIFDAKATKRLNLASLPSPRVAGTLVLQQAGGLALIGGGAGKSSQAVRTWVFLIP